GVCVHRVYGLPASPYPHTLPLHDALPICSKHITLNATGGGFLTASKQFRHGATSKSRSNTASNSTKHKSPHLSGWRQIISCWWRDRKSGSAGMPRPNAYAVFCLKTKKTAT